MMYVVICGAYSYCFFHAADYDTSFLVIVLSAYYNMCSR
jgi:hypothetical protein